MLRPEQVKPLLLHEDRDVRGNASQYFADCGSLDPEVAELILQAILKCDCNKLYGQIPVHNLRKVVAGASTAPLLLKAFEKYDHPSILRDLNYAVGRLPIDAWDQHEQLLLQSGKVDKSVKERIERRRRLAAMDGEQLMEKLEEFSDGNDGKDSSELDHAQLEDLLEALAAKQHPEPAELRRLLENEFARDEWTHTHLVELAGIRRMDEFVPLLTEYLAYDEDEVLQEAAQRALSLIGNRNVVELIRARFPEYSWETKLYASGVLGAIHDESAEKTILELLRSERDGSSRARLCIALGDQFSHAGIEAISRELRDPGDLDGHREVDLEESLLALSLALDVDIPERRGLLLARLERDQHFDSLVDRDDFAFFDDSDDDEVEFEDDDWVEPDGFAEEPPIPRPIVASRVPRPNERCPCGSGKKYKRCCQNA